MTELVGRASVAKKTPRLQDPCRILPALWVEANGKPAALVTRHGDAVALVTADVSERGIERIMWVVSPAKLAKKLLSFRS